MIRTWRLQTLTGNAQPVFGDLTTAAIPLTESDVFQVKVTDTTLYRVQDRFVIGAGSATNNIVQVEQIVNATTLLCSSVGGAKMAAYATSAVIQLAIVAADICLSLLAGSSNPVYLGTDNTVTNLGAGNAFYQATTNNPWKYTNTVEGNNPVNTAEVWMAAPAATQAIAYAVIS